MAEPRQIHAQIRLSWLFSAQTSTSSKIPGELLNQSQGEKRRDMG